MKRTFQFSWLAFTFCVMLLLNPSTALAQEYPDNVMTDDIYAPQITDAGCDHVWEVDSTDDLNESYTCTDDGISAYVCANCGSKAYGVIPAAHTIVEELSPATVNSNYPGYHRRYCSVCYDSSVYYYESWAVPSTVTLSYSKTTYTGSEKKPKVTVKDRDDNVIDSKYYTVTYKNNVNPGFANVTVTFKDRYDGTVASSFQIKPKKISSVSVKYKSTASMVVTWKTVPKVSGYVIEYSTSSSFKEGNTCTIFVSGSTTKTKTIKNLAKKTYYVRVAGYKTYYGVKYRGSFSDKKKVAIKTGASVKTMINSIKSTTANYKQILELTNNKVNIKKYSTTYDRMKAIYTWHAKNSSGFVHCLACNYNYAYCIYLLTEGSKSFDNWIRIACDTYKNNSGSQVQHKWCVLYLQGVPYIFDPRMQGNMRRYTSFDYFGATYSSSVGKHYKFEWWYI